ncbi:MAG: phosphoglycerate kinase [Chloroherpetonaceae bacterium]|nr:phosphoglycerate kinase [Chloroherpetonaceae bacterium]MDW8436755.1 phosphoglycerate kinase [Chloroherpetonaceae bacterium]
MNKKTIRDIAVAGKRVLMRVDFNVPLDKQKNIEDDTRIRESLPTIQHVVAQGGKLILMSHLGRPKGKSPEFSLEPVAKRLSELLGKPVKFAPDCIGKEAEDAVNALQNGDVLLLENVRFYKEEEANDPEFAKKLAALGDVYVNDAFGTAHRAHASTEGVAKYLSTAVAGFLIEKELKYLGEATANPKRPFVAILGGAKISGKIDVLQNLMEKVDAILVGGAMIFTFFKAQGLKVGKSLVEDDKLDVAKAILDKAKSRNVKLRLPTDVVIADKFENDANSKTVPIDAIEEGWMGLDIGAETIRAYRNEILNAKTIVWNGPMGVFEMDKFAVGTMEIAKALADATRQGAITVIGGGDSASAIAKAGLEKAVTHVSTGGGASLEFLEGKTLPGIAALNDK